MDFLDRSSRVTLPVGGGASGFIGQWVAAIRWQFFTDVEPSELAVKPDSYRQAGSGYWVYYIEGADAIKTKRELGDDYPPSLVWLFEAPIETVLLPEEVKARFGSVISMECSVKTLRSGKYRHEFQLIALPAAVAAYAQHLGYIDYEFDVSEITDRDLTVTDDFAAKYIGGEYFDLEAEENTTLPYTQSTLWKRRVALWKDLGEDDPTTYNMVDSGEKFSTSSERLSECLAIASFSWTQPIWARVAMVSDPRMDATYENSSGETKRRTLPALLKIYANEEEARADSNVGDSEQESEQESLPPLPSDWAGMQDDWIATLKAFKAEMGNPPLPVAKAKIQQIDVESKISASADDALAWWVHV